MAREYGKVLTTAWTDREFCALTRRAQGTYWFLTSQADLNRAGVVTMALNRWASRCGENDRQVILDDLAELARGRFIIVDEAEEELLLRTYIRNDDGWKSPNIMLAVASAARQISSETLRSVIADELAKIDTSGLSTTISEKTKRSTKEFVESVIKDARRTLNRCEKNPSVMAWGTLSETLPRTLSDEAETGTLPGRVPRGFLTKTETEPETKPETETSPREIAAVSDNGFDAFWDAYAKKVGRKAAGAKYALAVKKPGVTPELLLRAATEYVAYQRAEGKHPTYSKDAARWLNGEHWMDERAAPRQPQQQPSKAEQRMAANAALTMQLRAEQETQQRAIEGNA